VTGSMADTILLVEDDEDIREALGQILADEGYTIVCPRTGRWGWRCSGTITPGSSCLI
jgi:DNA-binding response OmpR family regulator